MRCPLLHKSPKGTLRNTGDQLQLPIVGCMSPGPKTEKCQKIKNLQKEISAPNFMGL